jgi:hypothetical protein
MWLCLTSLDNKEGLRGNMHLGQSRKYGIIVISSTVIAEYMQNYVFKAFIAIEESKSNIFQFIEGFYNRTRRHSYLNYLSPFDFELLYFKLVA